MAEGSTAAGTPQADARTFARRILAALLALVALVPFFGLVDLGTVLGLSDPTFQWAMPLEASWGAFFTCLLGGAYLWLVIGRKPCNALLLLAVATVALAVAGVGGLDVAPLVVAGGVALSAVALGLLDPALRPRMGVEVRLPVLLLPVAALAIWLPYALAALSASRGGAPGDETNGISHWPVQAAAGIALILGSALVALVRRVRPLQAAVAVTGAIIALTTLAYPTLDGATGGPVWAVLALLWSVVAAVLPAGRRRVRSADPVTENGRRSAVTG